MSTRENGRYPVRLAFGFALALVVLPTGAMLLRAYSYAPTRRR